MTLTLVQITKNKADIQNLIEKNQTTKENVYFLEKNQNTSVPSSLKHNIGNVPYNNEEDLEVKSLIFKNVRQKYLSEKKPSVKRGQINLNSNEHLQILIYKLKCL